ncbi:MAG: hypothetical protein S4CHLAM20_08090 [Chlamydiia bacterium]|nr:hypothetical protein [Chlamydiia bacterium]
MKKILLFLVLVIFVIAITPYALPQSMRKEIFYYLTRNIPGKFTVSRIEYSLFQGSYIDGISWENDNAKVYCPKLYMNTSLYSFVLSKDATFSFENGSIYYKQAPLLEKLSSTIDLKFRSNNLILKNPSKITCKVNEKGTKTFVNHAIIPPFSAQKVEFDLHSGSLKNYQFKNLKLKGVLSLHTLQCTKNHLLASILALLKQAPSQDITVKCGDINFTLDNGILGYTKTPFILDNAFEILSKGTVNMINEQINIVLGFTTESLSKAFNLTSLPPGYIVPFTVKGTYHNPKFDTKQAAKNIALIILLEKIAPDQRSYPKPAPF